MSGLPPAVADRIDRQVGALLTAAAIDLQSEQKRAMSKSFPPASKAGQYLRGRRRAHRARHDFPRRKSHCPLFPLTLPALAPPQEKRYRPAGTSRAFHARGNPASRRCERAPAPMAFS